MLLSGCTDDEEDEGEIGTDENFIGTWTTGSGSFTAGDSIRFNDDYTCDFFWSHGGSVLFNGTWTIKDLLADNPTLVITMEEQTYNYSYNFYYGFNQLQLIPEGETSGFVYYKQ